MAACCVAAEEGAALEDSAEVKSPKISSTGLNLTHYFSFSNSIFTSGQLKLALELVVQEQLALEIRDREDRRIPTKNETK